MTTANPQSFNRYSYTQNDPVNFVDPSGLDFCLFGVWSIVDSWDGTGPFMPSDTFGTYPGLCNAKSVGSSGGGGDGRGGGGGGGGANQKPKNNPTPLKPAQPQQKQSRHDCIRSAIKTYLGDQAVSLFLIWASQAGMGITAYFVVLSGGAIEAVEAQELATAAGILRAVDAPGGPARFSGGVIAFGALSVHEFREMNKHVRELKAAVNACNALK